LAAKKKYILALNLGFLGFSFLLSLFENYKAEENFLGKSFKHKHYDFSVGNLVERDKNSGSKVKLVVHPKKTEFPQKGVPIPRNKSRPKYPDQIDPRANGLKAHKTTGAAS